MSGPQFGLGYTPKNTVREMSWVVEDWRNSALVVCGLTIVSQFYFFTKRTFVFSLRKAEDAPLKCEDSECSEPIHLHLFGDSYPLVSASPFNSKITLYCRLAGVPHTTNEAVSKLDSVPKKKAPFVIHNGKLIEDSQLIIRYIENTFDAPAMANEASKRFVTNIKPFKCYDLLDDNQKVF